MSRRTVFTAFGAALMTLSAVPVLAPAPAAAQQRAGSLSPELLEGLHFREIGPAVTGGRIHDVEALPDDPSTLYVATASGGLWKTTNHGVTWTPIFDDQPVSTFGDVAISPSDPDVVWAGTGEQQNRQSTSWGNGVYRSTDGGESWTHLGLEETRHIGRVVAHPSDPDVAYVAALGNLWAPGEARGVYRTTDAGRSWEKVLYVDTLTGVVDLVMDPSDPNTLYAAAYQRLRRSWGFNGGGPGSGIYKTTDGGERWRELTNGVPEGDKGRIGLAIARTDPEVVMATIETADDETHGTYRSEDGGASWEKVNDLNPRAMYYSHIYIDPTNEDRVYVLYQEPARSDDGGRTFTELPSRATYDVGVHSDHHTMWIDPNDPEHFYLAGDAGLHETWDMGLTYRRINNFAIGQFYDIGLDMRDPYWIYGGMQDNHSFMGPNETRSWLGVLNDHWKQIGFGDGMWHAADPTSHRFVYSTAQNGNLYRVDGETGDRLNIEPAEPEDEEYRFDWVTPVVVSRHDPATVYLGGNRLFISRDRGESWERTEDLTRAIDRDTLELMGMPGGEITISRNDGTSSFGEITTIAESPVDPDVLWVGTDDGNVQVSRDGGEMWTNVVGAVPGVPDGAYVSRVIGSARGAGAAYVTFDAHRRGDFRPFVYRTDDFGRSWEPLHGGLPEGSVNVIREHPDDPALLFLGTEHALFVSNDAGERWTRFPGLPTTLYDDLEIHPRDDDLVAGTHGRSILILDDLAPLTEWSATVASSPAHLFSPPRATIFWYWKDTSYRAQAEYMGENPPFGARLSYHLAERDDDARISVRDADGRLVREFDVPGDAGVIHRVTWDLRHEPADVPDWFGGGGGDEDEPVALPEPPQSLGPFGPFVSPGTYTVTLEANGATSSRDLAVRGDPRMPLTVAEYREREAFLLDLAAMQREVADALERADDGDGESVRRLDGLRRDLARLAGELSGGGVQPATLYPPTQTQRQRRAEIETALARVIAAVDGDAPVGGGGDGSGGGGGGD
ncbi:MAG: WD40/YVTN/BNR-like repeat-containing protein [Gemmatimonadota bacterium]